MITDQYTLEWRQLIHDVRQVYDGPVTYAAHWDKEFSRIAFWDALDVIGINAYFPLDAPENATLQQLVAAWQPNRRRIAALAAKAQQALGVYGRGKSTCIEHASQALGLFQRNVQPGGPGADF